MALLRAFPACFSLLTAAWCVPYRLPTVQGGMDAVRDMRRTWPRYKTCKIIAVTADAFEDTRDNCIAVRACVVGWGPEGAFCVVWERRRPGGPRHRLACLHKTAAWYCFCACTCLQCGFDGWLAKPFRVEEFAKVLQRCRTGAALTPPKQHF